MSGQTASAVDAALRSMASPDMKAEVARFFFDGLGETDVLGVGIGKVFPVAKAHAGLPLGEIGLLLDSRFYEMRMAAAAIMDFQARAKKSRNALEALYRLYLDRHDRLDNWDLVDRAAPHVVGQYLFERPRTPLYELAESTDPWRRRTAIVATWYFIRAGQVEDTFAICAKLAGDRHLMVQKAIGSWMRTAGEKDPERLKAFLRAHGDMLSAETVRITTEKMPPEERQLFRKKR